MGGSESVCVGCARACEFAVNHMPAAFKQRALDTIYSNLPSFDGHVGHALCNLECQLVEARLSLPPRQNPVWSGITQQEDVVMVKVFGVVGDSVASTSGTYNRDARVWHWPRGSGVESLYFEAYSSSEVRVRISHSTVNALHVRSAPTSLGEVVLQVHRDIIPMVICSRPVAFDVTSSAGFGSIILRFNLARADVPALVELVQAQQARVRDASVALATELAAAFDSARDINLAEVQRLLDEGANLDTPSRRKFQPGDLIKICQDEFDGVKMKPQSPGVIVQTYQHSDTVKYEVTDQLGRKAILTTPRKTVHHRETMIFDVVRNTGATVENVHASLEMFERAGAQVDAKMVALACERDRTVSM